MLIVALLLLVVGIVTFGVGLFSTSPAWVLVSIVVTAVAGVVLLVGRRSLRARVAVPSRTDTTGPAVAADTTGPAIAADTTEPAIAAASTVAAPLAEAPDVLSSWPEASEEPAGAEASGVVLGLVRPPATDELAVGATPEPDAVGGGPSGDRLFAAVDQDFPITGYEELRVAELLPLLADLDPDALAVVQRREVAEKGRPTVLARIDELMAIPEEGFPIAAYDSLRVVDVLPLLRSLDIDELSAVADRERRGAARQTILGRIDEMLDAPRRPRRPSDPPEVFSGDEAPAGSIAP